MSRPSLVVALALVAGVTAASAEPKKPIATKTKARTKAKPATKAAKSSKQAKRSTAKDSRVPTKTTGNNMPSGWSWPPNKAMLASAKTCMAKLDDLGIQWKPAEKEGHMIAPVMTDMTFGGVKYSFRFGGGPRKLDCHLAVALEAFGKDLHALGVREVKYGSIYRYTKVRVGGETKNVLSRHALGMAMDITSFVDDAGREAWVAKDYKTGDALLLDVEKAVNASGKFRLLLTPKNDPISHKDHFHLEANPEFHDDAAPVPASDDPGPPTQDADDDDPDESSASNQ